MNLVKLISLSMRWGDFADMGAENFSLTTLGWQGARTPIDVRVIFGANKLKVSLILEKYKNATQPLHK